MKGVQKRILGLMVVLLALVTLVACGNGGNGNDDASDYDDAPENGEVQVVPGNGETLVIGVFHPVEHPAFEDAAAGFKRSIEAQGWNVEWDVQNAHGDAGTMATIAQRFANNQVDLVLAMGTPAVQAMANETSEIPILGTAITSFEAAGVVDSHANPGRNVSGTSNLNRIDEQVDLVFEIMGEMDTIGLLYTSGAANSEMQAAIAREHLAAIGVAYDAVTVTSVGELQQAQSSLAARVDAIWIPTDNTVASALELAKQISVETGVPLFPSENGMVLGAGIATLSVDHYHLGYQTGEMAGRLLRGEADIATMPVEYSNHLAYIVNGELAEQLGIIIPERLLPYVQ